MKLLGSGEYEVVGGEEVVVVLFVVVALNGDVLTDKVFGLLVLSSVLISLDPLFNPRFGGDL